MDNTITTLFYPKSDTENKLGLITIYCRITVNGRRAEFSTKQKITMDEWQSNRTSKNLKTVKGHLSIIESKIKKVQEYYDNNSELFTAQDVKNRLANKHKSRKTALEVYQEHNDKIKALVALNQHSYGSYRRFIRGFNHLEAFITSHYNVKDILLNKVDLEFVETFEQYLLTKKIGGQNTITKYLTNFHKIIRIAHAKKWIEVDPFKFWTATWKKTERDFLSQNEIDAIYEKEINLTRLKTIRDVFIFCCYTGLAYCDVEDLRFEDISIGIDGKFWIYTNRLKTNNRCAIPLLPLAQVIYSYYALGKSANDKIFPLASNQKTNAYLKEIATISGIQKNLTFHMARHSFATTITLTNGVPISTVSKMLGHSSIKTTQIYARVVDLKISNDMMNLETKLERNAVNT